MNKWNYIELKKSKGIKQKGDKNGERESANYRTDSKYSECI